MNHERDTLHIKDTSDSIVLYVAKKSEKISAASIFVSDYIKDNIEIKTLITRHAIALVEASFALRKGHLFSSEEAIARLRDTLQETSSALTVAALSRHISGANARAIQGEIHLLLSYLVREELSLKKERERSGITIDHSMFHIEAPKQDVRAGITLSGIDLDVFPQAPQTESKRHEKNVLYNVLAGTQTMSNKEETVLRRSWTTQKKERIIELQKNRKIKILSLLQEKDSITIKDIKSVIKDCSEKTIQRELLSLVAHGVLKKKGERRWSTYSLP